MVYNIWVIEERLAKYADALDLEEGFTGNDKVEFFEYGIKLAIDKIMSSEWCDEENKNHCDRVNEILDKQKSIWLN